MDALFLVWAAGFVSALVWSARFSVRADLDRARFDVASNRADATMALSFQAAQGRRDALKARPADGDKALRRAA